MITVDSHQHFWDPSRGDYGWLRRDMGSLYRVFSPTDLAAQLLACGVQGTVLVQAAPTEAETDYMVEMADNTPWVLGIVGWVDLGARDVSARIVQRRRHPKFVGIRPMLQDMGDLTWLIDPAHARAFETLSRENLVFDALIRVTQAKHIVTLAERYPDLRIVVDHAAKPAIARKEQVHWIEAMSALAGCRNVWCKYSGLLSEAQPGAGVEELRFYSDALLELFGPRRLLWGSDWPVLTTVSDYLAWFEMTRALLTALNSESLAHVMGKNAIDVYRIAPP